MAQYRLPGKSRRNICVVFDAYLIREALEAEEAGVLQQGLPATWIPRLPNMAMQSVSGDAHRWRRAILAPAFSAASMDNYGDIVVEAILAAQGEWRDGREIEVVEELLRLAAGVMLTIGVGRDMRPDPELAVALRPAVKWEFIARLLPFPKLVRRLPLPSMIRAEQTFEAFRDLISRAIERSRHASSNGRDLVSHLVRSRGPDGDERLFDDAEIHDELCLLLLSGMGVTAASLSIGLDYLAWNPGARERLENEADRVLAGEPISVEDHDRLPYARATVREILRLAPGGFIVDKVAARDFVLGGRLIPRGTVVQPCIGLLQRQEKYFENAGEFRPERWLETPRQERPPHAYIPFSHGFRTCLGAELVPRLGTYLLASLAQRWRLEPTATRPGRTEFPFAGPYRLKGGLRMILRERSSRPPSRESDSRLQVSTARSGRPAGSSRAWRDK